MTKWTVLDIPRSDFKVARQRGARAGRRAHVNATQFRSAAFKPWRHPTTKRRFALFLDVGENFAAKELGAFWCHDEKQWMYETSRTDADIPRWIHRRRVPFPRVQTVHPVPHGVHPRRSQGGGLCVGQRHKDMDHQPATGRLAHRETLGVCRRTRMKGDSRMIDVVIKLPRSGKLFAVDVTV